MLGLVPFVLNTKNLKAQNPMVLNMDFNNASTMLSTDGRMFSDHLNGLPGYEVPLSSNNHTIYTAGLWLGGIDEDDALRFSGQRFCQNGCLFGPGPLKEDGSYESPSDSPDPFNRFWIVLDFQVQDHLNYHDCLNDPNCDTSLEFPQGYTTPPDFITWPAMGDVENGYPEYLAPFFDYDGDGIYNAEAGDHPLFCGDIATYNIYNDIGFRDQEGATPGLGIEVHQMNYAYFSAGSPALFNTSFVQKRIINRSEQNYSDVYVGLWTDFDIGNPFDDYIGTDVQRSMVFGYNGTDFDQASVSGPGYGNDLPAMGLKVLRGPLRDADGLDNPPLSEDFVSYGDQTTGWGDGIPDNERLGLSSSLYHSNVGQGAPAPTTDPQTPIEFYNFLRNVWKDGTPVTVGGLGYDPMSGMYQTSYMFDGLSDPLLAGTGGVDPNYPLEGGWTEVNVGNPPGDRRMLASSGPFTLGAGEEQVIDYAYIFARDSHEPGVDVLETLGSYADAIVGMECGELPQIITSVRDHHPGLEMAIFPNPASHSAILKVDSQQPGRYHLYDLTGRLLLQGITAGTRTEISVGHLPKGMYLLRYEHAGQSASGKLVVE